MSQNRPIFIRSKQNLIIIPKGRLRLKKINMKTTSKILAIILISIFSFGTQAQTMDEIIKKHIDAIGGKDNWAKLKSMKMVCTMKANGADIKITITHIDKKAMRQDIAVMGMNGYSIITEKEGWTYMPFQGQTKPEPMTADDVKNSQEGLFIQDDFITYKDQGKKLEYIGKDDVDGTECFKIKMTDKNGQETSYFIDPSNYYTIKQTTKFKADGKEMEGSSMYSNYKKLPEGIVYPMTISGGFGTTDVATLEINPKIDESVFKPTVPPVTQSVTPTK